ncbi:MAG: hypothetical protein CM15mP79_2220 [Methanobacteriota archaeon]|nr:MAG: hypothetical protein CM15mP79_2220 [Euryarchaeota archaeon]
MLNQTELDLTLLEDGVLDVDLLPLAWDADGDLPVVSIVDPPAALAVVEWWIQRWKSDRSRTPTDAFKPACCSLS